MPAKDGYMTDEYDGDQYGDSALEVLLKIVFFPFFVIGRALGVW
jgi:hypothetical protein